MPTLKGLLFNQFATEGLSALVEEMQPQYTAKRGRRFNYDNITYEISRPTLNGHAIEFESYGFYLCALCYLQVQVTTEHGCRAGRHVILVESLQEENRLGEVDGYRDIGTAGDGMRHRTQSGFMVS